MDGESPPVQPTSSAASEHRLRGLQRGSFSEMEGTARKRDRDSQFGPMTPGTEDPNSAPSSDTSDSVGTAHTAKKNRILSRDNSMNEIGASHIAQQHRSSTSTNAEDLDITPPGTPVVPPSTSAAIDIGRRSGSGNGVEPTPPGTPVLAARSIPGSSTLNLRETSKVKEMRERVQEMTTEEQQRQNNQDALVMDDEETPAPPITSSASTRTNSPPPEDVQESIAELPSSAAEAEKMNHDTDTHIEEADTYTPLATKPSFDIDAGMDDDGLLPPPQPLTRPAVAALSRAQSTLIPPPSPASSIRAETGSSIGDTDYLTSGSGEMTPSRSSASRMSSTTSMRNAYNAHAPNNLSQHLHLHSSLPKTSSSLDVASDAMSDISTEANPPGTPRPFEDPETPTTSLPLTAGALAVHQSGTDAPAQTQAAESSTPTAEKPPSSATPAKPFVNPFSSFGSTSSPFASSSASAFGNKSSTAPSTSSNLSTAKPFGPFGSGSGNPFASASTGSKSGFGSAGASASAGGERPTSPRDSENAADDHEDSQERKDKIFSSQNEVHMVTGEEEEFTQCMIPRAKLYVLDESDWKERGVGQLRLNSKADLATDKLSVRLVMRAEAVHRLILNVPLFAGMSVTLAQDKFVRFSAFEDGALRHYTIRIQNSTQSKELYEHIQEMVKMLARPSDGKAEV